MKPDSEQPLGALITAVRNSAWRVSSSRSKCYGDLSCELAGRILHRIVASDGGRRVRRESRARPTRRSSAGEAPGPPNLAEGDGSSATRSAATHPSPPAPIRIDGRPEELLCLPRIRQQDIETRRPVSCVHEIRPCVSD